MYREHRRNDSDVVSRLRSTLFGAISSVRGSLVWGVKGVNDYRGTSLMRNCFLPGPYSRPYDGPGGVEVSYERGTPAAPLSPAPRPPLWRKGSAHAGLYLLVADVTL